MCQFIETMCVEQGRIINLDYHLERIKNTRKHFWNTEKTVPTDQFSALAATQDSKAKLRFVYDKEIRIRHHFTFILSGEVTQRSEENKRFSLSFFVVGSAQMSYSQKQM